MDADYKAKDRRKATFGIFNMKYIQVFGQINSPGKWSEDKVTERSDSEKDGKRDLEKPFHSLCQVVTVCMWIDD